VIAVRHAVTPWLLLGFSCLTGTASAAETAQEAKSMERAASSGLVVTRRVDHIDRLAREPMIVEQTDGTLFVAGYGGQYDEVEKIPDLWRSRDLGATWNHVNVGNNASGAIGNSDVDLAVGSDDTLYFVTMTFDNQKSEGTRIAVGVSRNAGATWAWKVLSENRFDDRPWVGVTPNGTAHVIWNDGNGVRYWVTKDHGASWQERPRINDRGGSSHLAVGPNGEIAVRITPASASGNKFTAGVDLIAVSRDDGKTWRKYPAPGKRDWNPDQDKGTPHWVEPLAWDERGALYSLWGSARGLWLAQSLDQGGTWKCWHIVDKKEVSYFPYLTARGQGELAATWYSGRGGTLKAHVAALHVTSGGASPHVIESQALQLDIWSREHPQDPTQRDTAGEYIPVIFLREGGLGVATTIQSAAGQAKATQDPNVSQKRVGFTWWNFAEP